MRLVVVMALRSHLLAAAAFGPYAVDERTYAASLWDTVPDQSLVLIDRNYLQANVLVPLTSKGTERHWITRVKSNTRFRLIRRLGNGDELVEFQVSSEARRKDPSLPTHFDARAIRYQRKGFQPQLLLTSLLTIAASRPTRFARSTTSVGSSRSPIHAALLVTGRFMSQRTPRRSLRPM